jgi:RNA polymerase sigma-70 factor (ECF subfamily)
LEQTHTDAARRRFELLFEEHRRAVLGYALRRVDEPADAADALAATFLVAWRRIDDVPKDEMALPWLLAVARRALANERRGARRRHALAERLGSELARQVPAPAMPVTGEVADLWRALATLPEEDREILLLAGWEELTPAQIAVVLDVRPVTARSRLHRARRRLRVQLDVEQATSPDARAGRRMHMDLVKKEAR